VLEEIIASLAGIIVGIITGLTPGIHINLVSAIVVSFLPITSLDPLSGALFIVTLAIAHTIIDFIPSIYLGAPNDETALTVLPSHQMLKEGKGHEAAVLALKGTFVGAALAIAVAPLIIIFSAQTMPALSKTVPFIIIFLISYLLLREKKIVPAIVVFLLSGLLGYLTLNIPVKEPLLPLLSGLFGAAGLLSGMTDKVTLVKQKIEPVKVNTSTKDLGAYTGIASLFSILPALGSGYASLVSAEVKENDSRKFIYSVGLMNMFIMISSFSFVYATQKARTGAAAAIATLLDKPQLSTIIIILVVCLLAAFFCMKVGIKISEKSAQYITNIRYDILSVCALVLMTSIVLIFSNLLGLIVFLTGAAIGTFTIHSGVRRTTMMGCLIIPTLLYYLI